MLTNIISAQNYETIRDAIGRVLTAELANQDNLLVADSKPAIGVGVFLERYIPFDKSELPAINIVYSDSEQQVESTSFTSVFDNKFIIEIYCNAETSENAKGDTIASLQVAKILGLVRSILMNNTNLHLDFVNCKFIQKRFIKSLTRTQPRIANDALNTISGVVEIHYFAEETTETQNGTLEMTLSTVVHLGETTNGYQFIIQT